MPTRTRSSSKSKIRKPTKRSKTKADLVSDHPLSTEKIEHRIVFVGTCANCEHVPMPIGHLIAVFSLMVFMLSGIVLYQSEPGLFEGFASLIDTFALYAALGA